MKRSFVLLKKLKNCMINILFTIFYFIIFIISILILILLIYIKDKKVVYPLLTSLTSLYLIKKGDEFLSAIFSIFFLILLIIYFIKIKTGLGVLESLMSAERLEKRGKYLAAAIKYERRKDYRKASECYEKVGKKIASNWCLKKLNQSYKFFQLFSIYSLSLSLTLSPQLLVLL